MFEPGRYVKKAVVPPATKQEEISPPCIQCLLSIQSRNASAHRIHWCLRSPLMNTGQQREKMMLGPQRPHLI